MLTRVAPKLPPAPLWLPFMAGPYRPAMGLIARPQSALTVFGDDYPEQMAARRALLATRRGEVFGALAGSEAARDEALRVVVSHLLADRSDLFARADGGIVNRITGERWRTDPPAIDPLELAGRLVQEDICLLRLDEGTAVLVAAVLCFPSRWRLADKLGRDMAAIHAPVPLYAEALERPVARFMRNLKPGRLVERFNWTIHDGEDLFQPVPPESRAVAAGAVGTELHLRVERQTLSLLPRSGAIMFTIRTRQVRLEEVMAVPGAAADLAGAVRGLPAEVAAYRSMAPFRDALLAALDRAFSPR